MLVVFHLMQRQCLHVHMCFCIERGRCGILQRLELPHNTGKLLHRKRADVQVRLGTYSARYGILPPAAVVATRAQATDPRAAPRYGERIPYVVVYGEPGDF